jgi:hypothetical protein
MDVKRGGRVLLFPLLSSMVLAGVPAGGRTHPSSTSVPTVSPTAALTPDPPAAFQDPAPTITGVTGHTP